MRVKLFKITDDSRVVHKTIGEGVEITAHIYNDMDIESLPENVSLTDILRDIVNFEDSAYEI